MTLLLQTPDDERATFAPAGREPAGFFDGPLGYIPGVALVKAEAGLAHDLLADDRRARMGELYEANDEAQTYIDNTFSRGDARTEAIQRRIDAIHAATGVRLGNPMVDARYGDGDSGNQFRRLSPAQLAAVSNITAPGVDKPSFETQLADLKVKFPQHAALFDPDFDPDTKAIVKAADTRQRKAAEDAEDLSAVSRLAATFAGAARGMLRDPLQVLTLGFGAGASGASTVAGRIGQAVLTEATINAGIEIPVQIAAQKWRAENGLESGVMPGLKQVGLAGLFGGALGGLMTGAGEIATALKVTDKAGRDAIERVAVGAPRAGDLATVSDRLGVPIDAADRGAADLAREQPDLDRAAFGEPPPGLTSDEAARLKRAGLDHVEREAPVPAGTVQKPARDQAEDPILSEASPSPPFLDVRDRPVSFERFDPETLRTDAAAYQYKGGGDDAGVTKRLAGVKRWDATSSGKALIHERLDGARYVADGHQRLGLAKRLKAGGDDSIALDGYLFREADGWTAADVRAFAAKKNMAEGSGEAIDAARIMRERPDILDDGLPMSGAMMRKATGLARLSPDAWSAAVNRVIDENHAALVGELLDPSQHSAAIADLAKFSPETDRAARSLIEEIAAAGVRHEHQTDMFGSFDIAKSLLSERVRVLEAAQRALRGNKRLFAMLAERADVIEAAGNQLDTVGNASRAVTAETLNAIIDRMARSRGPVSDALTEAARRNAAGSSTIVEGGAFVKDVQALIERDGIRALLEPPKPQLAPARVVEPASPEAAELAGDMPEPAIAAPKQASLWDVLPDGTDADGATRYTTGKDLFDRASLDDDAADLVDVCKAA